LGHSGLRPWRVRCSSKPGSERHLLDRLASGPSLFADGSLFKNHVEAGPVRTTTGCSRVVYAAGRLWTGLNTVVPTKNGPGAGSRGGVVHRGSRPSAATTVDGNHRQSGIPVAEPQPRRLPRRSAVNARRQKASSALSVIGPDQFSECGVNAARRTPPAERAPPPRDCPGVGAGPLDDFQRLRAVWLPRRPVGATIQRPVADEKRARSGSPTEYVPKRGPDPLEPTGARSFRPVQAVRSERRPTAAGPASPASIFAKKMRLTWGVGIPRGG